MHWLAEEVVRFQRDPLGVVGSETNPQDKDAELKAVLAKVADLEKTLQERDRTIDQERCGTLLEAQHLEVSFSSKCFS